MWIAGIVIDLSITRYVVDPYIILETYVPKIGLKIILQTMFAVPLLKYFQGSIVCCWLKLNETPESEVNISNEDRQLIAW